jgi:DNA repair protein RadC
MARARDGQGQYKLAIDSDEAILAAAEAILMKRVNTGPVLADPAAAGRMLTMRLGNLDHEVFCVLFLTTRHRVIAIENMFRGGIDGCEVQPREIAKRALELSAAACIVAHNHPSGDSTPSAADRACVARLKQSLALIDVRLLDSFVVGAGAAPVSMAAIGWV